MYCPECRSGIPNDSVTCPECGIEIAGAGARQRGVPVGPPPLLTFGGIGSFVIGCIALLVALFIFLAAMGAVPRVLNKSGSWLPKVEWVESVIAHVRSSYLRGLPRGVKWLLVPVFYLVALADISKALDFLQKRPPFRSSEALNRLLTLCAILSLGLFAMRCRVELFKPLGRFIDGGLNGAALGVGIAVAIAAVFTRGEH